MTVRKYLTTAEAAEYLRFRSSSGIRSAVSRGDLRPAGVGPRNTLLFTVDELERFVTRRALRYIVRPAMGCLGQKGSDLMRKSGEPTKYPGVSRIASKTYQVRGKVIDPRTGKPKEVDRIINNVTLLQAVRPFVSAPSCSTSFG